MKKLLIMALAFMALPAWALDAKDAALAAKSVATPNFADVLTDKSINATLPADAQGNTETLQNLKGADGMGDITGAGRVKSDACMDQNDPECLAIQAVRGTAGWSSDLDNEEAIRGDYVDVMDKSETLTEGVASTLTQERICKTVTTHIEAREALEVCDEALLFEAGTCTAGWTMKEIPQITYLCEKMTEGEVKTCEIRRQVLSHEEERWQCTVEPQVEETRTCTIENNPTVSAIYPYTCTKSEATTVNKTCVKTLVVNVYKACNQNEPATNEEMERFVDVGYTASSRYQRLLLVELCSNQFAGIEVRFGTRLMGTFSSVGQTLTFTFGSLTFHATLTLRGRTYTVTLTNVDAGKGTLTITCDIEMIRNYQEIIDSYTETCNVS